MASLKCGRGFPSPARHSGLPGLGRVGEERDFWLSVLPDLGFRKGARVSEGMIGVGDRAMARVCNYRG